MEVRRYNAALVRVGCFVPLRAAWGLFVCFRSVLLVRARGRALRLGVCLLMFPTVCAVTRIPTTASLCNGLPHL